MLKIVTDDADRDDLVSPLGELVAEGARRMLIAGLVTEVAAYIERHEGSVDEVGRRRVAGAVSARVVNGGLRPSVD